MLGQGLAKHLAPVTGPQEPLWGRSCFVELPPVYQMGPSASREGVETPSLGNRQTLVFHAIMVTNDTVWHIKRRGGLIEAGQRPRYPNHGPLEG